jgi:succinylarginine dihydrolase
LINQFHRSVEAETTCNHLRAIFKNPEIFKVTAPLPPHPVLGDEGAANHTRFFGHPDQTGIHCFVYGDGDRGNCSLQFPARQTEMASRAVARLGGLQEAQTVFLQQSTEAINAGVFHNDVIAVGQGNTLFYHEAAFENSAQALDQLAGKFIKQTGQSLNPIKVKRTDVTLEDAVASYLFNSQLIAQDTGQLLVVPIECAGNKRVSAYLEWLVTDTSNSINEVLVQDLRQTMRNGGGPACLRLRVYMSAKERAAVSGRVFLDAELYADLKAWIERHYRAALSFDDLRDPNLVSEIHCALESLSEILQLPQLFQP